MQSINSNPFAIQSPSNVSILLNRNDNEEVCSEFRDVTLVFNGTSNGTGNVHLTNLKLIWVNHDSSKNSYSFPYKSIMFHAVSKDTNLYPNPCIFIQFNLTNDEDDNYSVLLSPNDPSLNEAIFEQISKLSTLNDSYPSDDREDNCEIHEG